MTIRCVREFVRFAKKTQNAPEAEKEKWQQDIIENRWKYFLTLPLFIAVSIFFLWLGFVFKDRMFIVYWYIWMGLAGLLLVCGIILWFWYLGLIIKYRK